MLQHFTALRGWAGARKVMDTSGGQEGCALVLRHGHEGELVGFQRFHV